jgi:hypothetical protein
MRRSSGCCASHGPRDLTCSNPGADPYHTGARPRVSQATAQRCSVGCDHDVLGLHAVGSSSVAAAGATSTCKRRQRIDVGSCGGFSKMSFSSLPVRTTLPGSSHRADPLPASATSVESVARSPEISSVAESRFILATYTPSTIVVASTIGSDVTGDAGDTGGAALGGEAVPQALSTRSEVAAMSVELTPQF